MRKNKTILGRLKYIGCRLDAIIEQCEDSTPVSIYTLFDTSTPAFEGDPCFTSPNTVETNGAFYHNGEEATPQEGDTVFSNPEGTEFPPTGWYSDGVGWYNVGLDGVITRELSCL